jgi:hypothetical protein
MSERSQHYKLLIQLESTGDLNSLVQGAVISTNVLQYYKIAKRMEELLIRRNYTQRYVLVLQVSEEFNVSKATVYRAMQAFKII